MADSSLTIATVKSLSGIVYARAADGHIRALHVGDTIREGEIVVTEDGSQVELEFVDGTQFGVTEGKILAIGREMMTEGGTDADEATIQPSWMPLGHDGLLDHVCSHRPRQLPLWRAFGA